MLRWRSRFVQSRCVGACPGLSVMRREEVAVEKFIGIDYGLGNNCASEAVTGTCEFMGGRLVFTQDRTYFVGYRRDWRGRVARRLWVLSGWIAELAQRVNSSGKGCGRGLRVSA